MICCKGYVRYLKGVFRGWALHLDNGVTSGGLLIGVRRSYRAVFETFPQ